MKIGYAIYCYKHAEELKIYDIDKDINSTSFEVGKCSQCQLESYERGIESLLSKGHTRNEAEL